MSTQVLYAKEQILSESSFEVGKTYYGSLTCAHGSFPVKCIKKTAKMVQFEHATLGHCYAPKRAKFTRIECGTKSYERAIWNRWYISSDSVNDNGWDMQTV